ncbi:MAG: sulfotransferase [Mastigocoleus sp.]
MSSKKSKVKVLYIAGFERSGSTVIHRVLGQINEFIALGELAFIWQMDLLDGRKCSCGESVSNCDFWKPVINKAFGGIDKLDLQEIVRLQKKARIEILTDLFKLKDKNALCSKYKYYFETLEDFYSAIQSTTKSRVIVDSSKVVWYASILEMLPNIELYVFHLIRNSNGVCYSLSRRKSGGEEESQWYNPLHASLSWTAKNSLVEKWLGGKKDRYLRMRYEDFVANPKIAIDTIQDLLQEEFLNPFSGEQNLLNVDGDHVIGGSPSSRSQTGIMKLKTDDKWKKEMNIMEKSLVTGLTFPLLMKYRYPLKINK